MKKTIKIKDFSTVVSDEQIGKKILETINEALSEHTTIYVDLEGVITIATFCSKQIFGQLCKKMGENSFFERIIFISASDQIKTSIRLGIWSALQENGD